MMQLNHVTTDINVDQVKSNSVTLCDPILFLDQVIGIRKVTDVYKALSAVTANDRTVTTAILQQSK